MPVGDVNSTASGSGARYNDGKTMLEYIPAHVLTALCYSETVKMALQCLDHFEARRWTAGSLVSALDNLVSDSLDECCKVFDFGAKKYAAWNWAKGMPWSVPMACMKRHLMALDGGEDDDPESGFSHWGHVMCNAVMLAHYEEYHEDLDDRAPSECYSSK